MKNIKPDKNYVRKVTELLIFRYNCVKIRLRFEIINPEIMETNELFERVPVETLRMRLGFLKYFKLRRSQSVSTNMNLCLRGLLGFLGALDTLFGSPVFTLVADYLAAAKIYNVFGDVGC